MSTIVLTGGGTAGHVTACLALIPYLKKKFDSVHYIGSTGGIERSLVTDPDVVYHEIACTKLVRSLTLKNLAIPFRLFASVRSAKKLLAQIQPDVVFGKGGFVTLPVALACGKIPLILHESDRSMGLANRIAARRAKLVCTTFELRHKKAQCTGTPIRQQLYEGSGMRFKRAYGITAPVLLVTGGSQGAGAVNAAIRQNLLEITRTFHIVHLTGKGKSVTSDNPRYTQIEYLPDPSDAFAAADAVITRGGANTLFELAALRKPMLIVPLPKGGGSRGDQVENAEYFTAKGLAISVDQESLSDLTERLKELYAKRDTYAEKLAAFKADGTRAVLAELSPYASKKQREESAKAK